MLIKTEKQSAACRPGKNFARSSGVFPTAGQPAGNCKQRYACPDQHQELRPKVGKRLIAPEHLGESVNGPGIDGEQPGFRSEERRVGKECRSGWSPDD